MSAEGCFLQRRVEILRVSCQQQMHYHNTPRGPCIKAGKDKDMINVIDKMDNFGIISRIVSHRFTKCIASKTYINDFCFLLSKLSGQSFSRCQDIPSFTEYGWQRTEGDEHSAATIILTLVREASNTCHELAKCSCKTKCSSRCE